MKVTVMIWVTALLAGVLGLVACGPSTWVKRAKVIEEKACACRNEGCLTPLQAELNSFADDAGKQKVSKADAHMIKQATENARKCVVSATKAQTTTTDGESRWVKRAKEIEKKACACKGEDCSVQFQAELKSFMADADKEKISMADAHRIKQAIENALKCVIGVTAAQTIITSGENIWVKRAKALKEKACACTGEHCMKQLMADLESFKKDAGNEKVSKGEAGEISRAAEAAMRCALRSVKSDGEEQSPKTP